MAFNWKYLIIAIIIFAAVSSSEKAYGKWIFALVMVGVVLRFGDKILPKAGL